jgi:hypothetical protein
MQAVHQLPDDIVGRAACKLPSAQLELGVVNIVRMDVVLGAEQVDLGEGTPNLFLNEPLDLDNFAPENLAFRLYINRNTRVVREGKKRIERMFAPPPVRPMESDRGRLIEVLFDETVRETDIDEPTLGPALVEIFSASDHHMAAK